MAAIPEGKQAQCVKTLEKLAMDTYLVMLQDACYSYIQMERLGSLFGLRMLHFYQSIF